MSQRMDKGSTIRMPRRASTILAPLLLAALLGLTACSSMPKNPVKTVTMTRPKAETGLLVRSSDAILAERKQDESAFMLISENAEALRWRLALIDHAQDSIDLQVFIWSNDESGRLLISRIIAASRRGVKVRLLVDDMPKDWSDDGTANVARMPNIQLRRFNPGMVRKGIISRALQMATQFRQLNRRMHNKQLIVDGHWGIIGGRNIGNPYFGLSKKYNNRDLDVLFTGAIIPQLGKDFDEYWNAEAAYPGELMAKALSARKQARGERRFEKKLAEDRELLIKTSIPIDVTDWTREFAQLPEKMISGTAATMQDSPVVNGYRGLRLLEQLNEAKLDVRDESCIITPYMIPSKDQLEEIERIGKEGHHRVRLLVPSMDSNNHTMAHSHYKKYRKVLLEAGCELYEFRGDPSEEVQARSDTPPVESDFISLHTKAFILDRHWVMLGSLNIDPRSIKINTEHLLIIESPELAERLLAEFETMTAPENAWAVTLNQKGKLRWTSSDGVRKRQPARNMWQRWTDRFYRLLPIERQL
jgi:putative cardiolipin synthase